MQKEQKFPLAKTWGTKILSTLHNNSIYREWADARKIAEARIKPYDLDVAQCL